MPCSGGNSSEIGNKVGQMASTANCWLRPHLNSLKIQSESSLGVAENVLYVFSKFSCVDFN